MNNKNSQNKNTSFKDASDDAAIPSAILTDEKRNIAYPKAKLARAAKKNSNLKPKKHGLHLGFPSPKFAATADTAADGSSRSSSESSNHGEAERNNDDRLDDVKKAFCTDTPSLSPHLPPTYGIATATVVSTAFATVTEDTATAQHEFLAHAVLVNEEEGATRLPGTKGAKLFCLAVLAGVIIAMAFITTAASNDSTPSTRMTTSAPQTQAYIISTLTPTTAPMKPEEPTLFGIALTTLWNLTSLELVSDELVAGSITSEIGLLTALTFLELSKNQLTGSIPTELGLLTALDWLYLEDNQLSGTIPTELGMLTTMAGLDLESNQLTGFIPSELGLLTATTELCLDWNELSGPIPTELGLLTATRELSLDTNGLTGSIPTELGLLAAMRELHLDRNEISGSIPTELGLLTATTELSLDWNGLNGCIPFELGLLTAMELLHLEENQLTGPIPTNLGLLTATRGLWLDNNQLTGTIPSELGLLTALSFFLLHNNTLVGTIPSSVCSMPSLSTNVQIDCDKVTCPKTCDCSCS
jgi:Leucine-rich repeat (LRR) protein